MRIKQACQFLGGKLVSVTAMGCRAYTCFKPAIAVGSIGAKQRFVSNAIVSLLVLPHAGLFRECLVPKVRPCAGVRCRDDADDGAARRR